MEQLSRRDAVKALTAVAGAAGLGALADSWEHPTVEASGLPKVAAVSPIPPTNTPVPQQHTATPTPTNTSVPQQHTPTPTPTNTSVPPTSTQTPTATATSTTLT